MLVHLLRALSQQYKQSRMTTSHSTRLTQPRKRLDTSTLGNGRDGVSQSCLLRHSFREYANQIWRIGAFTVRHQMQGSCVRDPAGDKQRHDGCRMLDMQGFRR